MPEGHTIHRMARDQAKDLAGHPVRTEARQDRFAAGAAALDGAVLERTEAYGKHLFHHYEGGQVLHVHLGLFGRFRRRRNPPETTSPNLRLRLTGPERSWDLTGAITSEVGGPDLVDETTRRLGPDPLRDDADPEAFVNRCARSRAPMGTLLLDQSVVAGIGNVYRAELLFLVGVDPRREGREVGEETLTELWDLAVSQLERGVRLNRIVTVERDHRPLSRIPRREARFVYKRTRCLACDSRIETFELAGRTTFACPVHQR